MSKILIIDDDKAFCDVAVMTLRKLGHEAVAINSLKNISSLVLQIAPDIILLDIEFPDADGVRKLPDVRMAAPDTPVILITNHAEDSYVSRAIKSNTDFILHKPIGFASLKETVQRFHKQQAPANENVRFGEYVLETKVCKLKKSGVLLATLTPQENRFLAYMASHPNQTIIFKEIYQHVWGDEIGNQHGLYNLKSKFNKLFQADEHIGIVTRNSIGLEFYCKNSIYENEI